MTLILNMNLIMVLILLLVMSQLIALFIATISIIMYLLRAFIRMQFRVMQYVLAISVIMYIVHMFNNFKSPDIINILNKSDNDATWYKTQSITCTKG